MRGKQRAAVIAARERRAKVEVLYLRGNSNRRALAEIFGVSKSTIQNDIDRIEREWEKRRLKTSTSERFKAIAFYEHAKLEAMDEWEKSKQDAKELYVSEGNGKTTKKKVRRGTTGNAALLQKALHAQERIDKISGNEAPIQVEEKTDVTVVDKRQQKTLRDVGKELGLDFSRIGTEVN